ncbi:hypothetical protein tb265_04410 [Gemmatimonadetes bacterium T265]|nr:hypothetical protein tb265_04410 [Gemmatimonadetes bacterium T265]
MRRAGARLRARLGRREAAPALPALEDVRRRLELVLAALYGRPLRVEPAPEPRPPSWVWRLLGAQRPAPPLATHAGDTIRLPHTLPATDADEALACWRLLALGQAERVVRGSAALVEGAEDPLERTLYALCEGAAVDRALLERTRAAGAPLRAARAAALAIRPPLALLPAAERDVEQLVRAVLAGDPAADGPALPDAPDMPAGAADAAASLAWARATAARLRAVHGRAFRAVLPVEHWGQLPDSERELAARVRDAPPALPVSLPGLQQESVSRGARRPDQTVPIPGAGGTPLGDAPSPPADASAQMVVAMDDGDRPLVPERVPERPPADGPRPSDRSAGASDEAGRVTYPEWDAGAGRHRLCGATVVLARAPEGDGAWADAILRDHAAVVRRVRQRFEPLRARRARLPRQPFGEELDLAACVDALVDRRTGSAGGDRLYVAVRPARRALAIAILVDVSGSTDAPVSTRRGETRQIIDVEKEALLLAGEALEALGDPFAVLTFSSRGAHAVRVTTIKAFAERHDAAVRRRIAAMRPSGNTRLGAAVRHATALLARQPAGHRLLLLLSDGRPNDADGYQGRYATEDARQAIHEARAGGVYPYCLTVDREEAEYLPHIFGAAGHTVLRRPEQLPLALVGAVRQLVGAGSVC